MLKKLGRQSGLESSARTRVAGDAGGTGMENRNPKSEIRKKAEARSLKAEVPKGTRPASGFASSF
ncbi:MAG: hypothetical protein NT154_40830 [Verrucomicrobia bacterium]|nr:hypothetical protein [Verrucomicrobiota bacterium]